jgi:hypothetical protein
VKYGVVSSTQRDGAYGPWREAVLDQHTREKGLSQEVHTEAICLGLNDDEVVPIENDIPPFGMGCDPMVVADNDEPINPQPTDAWA